ncbi:MAG: hypothetical protein ACE5IO_01180 [Thermoplasmata archaeon]
MRRDRKGQSSVFDATVFLAIMLIASSLLIGLSESVFKVNDVSSFEDMSAFTGRLAYAALGSTVPNASYSDADGEEIIQRDISVQDMIIEELLLLQGGLPAENFGGAGRYNDRIEHVFSSLANESPYFYALHGNYHEVEIIIGNSNLTKVQELRRVEKATYVSEIFVPGDDEPISIILQVWRR